MSANVYEADPIYRDMARFRTFPDGLFTGSAGRLAELAISWEDGG
jgi:hypothetical protein